MTLLVTFLISLALSGLTLAVLAAPLRALLARTCGDDAAVHFWLRFTALMLLLAPLLVALAFSMPSGNGPAAPALGDIVLRACSAAIFGLLAALGAIGLRLSSLSRLPQPRTPTVPRWEERA
jgi:hypothetical protein